MGEDKLVGGTHDARVSERGRPSTVLDDQELMGERRMPDGHESTIESIVTSLRERLGEHFDVAVITEAVAAELARFSRARVTQYVPILVERRVAACLRWGALPSQSVEWRSLAAAACGDPSRRRVNQNKEPIND